MIDVFDLDSTNQEKKSKEEDINYVGLDRDIYLKKKEIERLTNEINAIKKSEKLRAKINKSIKGGEPIEKLLKYCIECISLMSGDKAFYTQNIEEIEKRYKLKGE